MSDPTNLITLSTTADVVSSLPSLVGYHPHNALVVVFLRDLHVAGTACLALPENLSAVGAQLARTQLLAQADEVFIAVYTRRTAGDLARHEEVAALTRRLGDGGVLVRNAVLVDDGRYWSYTAHASPGWPDTGTDVPTGPTALEAARVAQGRLATAVSREELDQQYRPRPHQAPTADVMQAAADVLALPVAQQCRTALDTACSLADRHTDRTPGDSQLLRSRLTLLVEHHVLVRDYLLCRAVNHPNGDALVDAVVTTALTTAPAHRAPVAATAAALLAAQGDNPVAAWALLALAEDESLARLVRDALQFGLPPDELRAVFAAALDEVVQRIHAAS